MKKTDFSILQQLLIARSSLGVCLVCAPLLSIHTGLADLTLCRICTCSCHCEFLGAASYPAVSGKHYFTIDGQSLWCLGSFNLYENHTNHRNHSERSFSSISCELGYDCSKSTRVGPGLEVVLHSTAKKLACKGFPRPSTQLDLIS